MRCRLFFVFFIFHVFNFVYAQLDTIYFDENKEPISRSYFYKKCKSRPYQCLRYTTDSIVVEKLKLLYLFGELEPVAKTQLFKLFHNRNRIDTNKVQIIHYNDTLRKASEYDKGGNVEYKYVFGHEHLNTYRGFIRAHSQCIKNYKRYCERAQVLHFYKINNGHPTSYKDHVWYEDNGGLISKLFLGKFNKTQRMIIRPNGEFFVGYEQYFLIEDLIEKKKWDKAKSEFETEIQELY